MRNDKRKPTSDFHPLTCVVDLDGKPYTSFDAYIASMPQKNSHVIPDERFRRFVCILRGDNASAEPEQLKRDREKLFNQKELGPKAPDGMRFPFDHCELH